MASHSDWEAATLELIQRLEEDRLKKAEQRLATAQRAVSTVKSQIDALHLALKVYRTEHGLAADDGGPPDLSQAGEYRNMSAKDMLHHWADTHGGQIVMRDAARFLAAGGLFRDEVQANGALYPAVGRSEEFEKVARGVYRRVSAPHSPPPPVFPDLNLPAEIEEDDTPELSLQAPWDDDEDSLDEGSQPEMPRMRMAI